MSNRRRVSGGAMASSIMAVDRILAKESDYKEAIVKNQTFAKDIAGVMAVDGEVAKLGSFLEDPIKGELQASLEEQRERIKTCAQRNVENVRTVNAFLGALQQVKTLVQQQQQQQQSNSTEELDYEELIKTKIQQYKAAQQDSQLEVHQEPYYQDVLKALGEQPSSLNDDDELQVLRNPSSSNNAQALTCPIMGTLMQDPVKSKLCGHAYSRQGIMQHLKSSAGRNGVTSCPVAGCNNRALSQAQLENDVEIEMKIRRHVRQQDLQRQTQATQDIMSDSDDE